jgi:hypothetical protein
MLADFVPKHFNSAKPLPCINFRQLRGLVDNLRSMGRHARKQENFRHMYPKL